MSPCFETMFYENGSVRNMEYHQKRFDLTRYRLFKTAEKIDLENIISCCQIENMSRVKVIYHKEVVKIECSPLTDRDFKTFRLTESNIKYSYKYMDRKELESIKKRNTDVDDVIIYNSEGLLKDTTIANIALYIEGNWVTPKRPLLHGTVREKLLKEKFLTAKDLMIEDINIATNFAIMNALIGFKEIEGDLQCCIKH